MDKLLLDERPLIVNPSLAEAIGLNEAIVLQQIHFWVKKNTEEKRNIRDGKAWTHNSYAKWQEDCFPFWSEVTIRRTFKSLEKMGILEAEQFGSDDWDQQKWYTIDYEKMDTVLKEKMVEAKAKREERKQKKEEESAKKKGSRKGKMHLPLQRKIEKQGDQNDHTDAINLITSTRSNCTDVTYNTSNKTTEVLSFYGFSADKSPENQTLFDMEIFDKQLMKVCIDLNVMDNQTITNIREICHYYFRRYERYFQDSHPVMNNKTLEKVVLALLDSENVFGEPVSDEDAIFTYVRIIDRHFNTDYKYDCNYSIAHFVSGDIRLNRFREIEYA